MSESEIERSLFQQGELVRRAVQRMSEMQSHGFTTKEMRSTMSTLWPAIQRRYQQDLDESSCEVLVWSGFSIHEIETSASASDPHHGSRYRGLASILFRLRAEGMTPMQAREEVLRRFSAPGPAA